MLAPYEQHARAKLVAIVVSIVVIAGVVMLADHLKSKDPAITTASSQTSQPAAPATSSDTTTTTTTPTDSTQATTSSYKDGSYSATSDYYVPHGQEEIQVTLTLQNGVVTAASIQNSESDRDSAMFQEDFASEYKQYVVGKKISSLQLNNIAGASDTTQAFNEAVSRIASKAQA